MRRIRLPQTEMAMAVTIGQTSSASQRVAGIARAFIFSTRRRLDFSENGASEFLGSGVQTGAPVVPASVH